jgi:hypothetical protein
MAQWADASSTNRIEHSSWDVDLADFDPNYDPAYDLAANCPMCRTNTTAGPDKPLAEQLEIKYPATYAQRRIEEEVERGSRVGQGGVEGVMILIGNKHKMLRGAEDDNEHDWTFFVRTSRPELVKEVRVFLVSHRPHVSCVLLTAYQHPTFRPPRLTLRKPPYEVRRLGWGTFTLEAEIVLKEPYGWIVDNSGVKQPGLELTWTLDFAGRGRQGRVRTKVKKFEEPPTDGRRVLRSRTVPSSSVANVQQNDEEDEDDGDYAEGEIDDDESLSESEEEEVSEFIDTPRR